MIVSDDLVGVETGLARRIISMARSVAPCLDSLEDEPRLDAIAILLGVAAEARGRGSRLIKSQRIGSASVDYATSDSWFSADDRSALRALCDAQTGPSDPVGWFPRAGLLNRVWPEHQDEC